MLRIIRRLTLSPAFIDKACLAEVRNFRNHQKIISKCCSVEIVRKQFYSTVIISPNEEEHSEGPNIQEIVGDDKELEHKLQVLILEADVLRQEGKGVPSNSFLKIDHWKELLRLPSKSGRRKYLEFLFKVEKKRENQSKKKELKRESWDDSMKPVRDPTDPTNYELGGNNIMLRVYDTTINQMYNNRLIQAMQFGQKLVVDCGFYKEMNPRENTNCTKQLMLLFSENRVNDEPFDLHYCNMTKDNPLVNGLHKRIMTLFEPWFPLNIHEEPYLDLFPKEKLVYLTPHCREELTEFSHEDIYIIGAIVDKVNNEPISMAKAKKEGIRMAKLPLDRYLDWGSGSGKSLTINQVTSILLDAKKTGDWKYALRHVPRRKLMNAFQPKADKKFLNRFNHGNDQRDVVSNLKYNANKKFKNHERSDKVTNRFNKQYLKK